MNADLRTLVLVNYGIGFVVGALICFLVVCTLFGWLIMLGVFPIVSSALMSLFMRARAGS